MQPRNSNLRELPIAPGNTNMNSSRPAANVRPVAKATQAARPEQSTQAVPAGGRGRGWDFAKTDLHSGGEVSTVIRKETQVSSLAPANMNCIYLFLTSVFMLKIIGLLMHRRFTYIEISIRNLMNQSLYVENNKSLLLNFSLEFLLRLHPRSVV